MKKSKLLAAVLTSATLIFGSLGIVSCSDGGGSDDNKKPVTPKYEVTDLSVESVKKAFVEGDTIPDVSNFTVTATLNGVADTVIPSTDYTVSIPVENETDDGKIKFSGNSETSEAEEIEVTITLVKDTTKTASCKITIAKPIAKIELDVTSLTKTSYKPGDAISTEGVVVKAFANEGDAEGTVVTDKAAITVDPATAASDTSKVTIKAAYLGKEDSKDASITIKSLEKIEVTVEDITGEVETGTATSTVFADKVKVKAVYGTNDNEEKVEVSDAEITFNPETLTTDSASKEVSVTITATYNGKTATANATVTVKNANVNEPIDMSQYEKLYCITTTENSVAGFKLDNWTSGAQFEKQADGSYLLTSTDKLWDGAAAGVVQAFQGIPKGRLALYDYIVIECDVSNFTAAATKPYQVKVPVAQGETANGDEQKDVAAYSFDVTGTKVFQIPTEYFTGNVEKADQFALIFYGTGTVTVKEIYIASEKGITLPEVTGITISPATTTVVKGGTQQFTVVDSNYTDITADCTFTIAEGDTTNSAFSKETKGLFTAGDVSAVSEVKVKATYNTFTSEEATVTIMPVEIQTKEIPDGAKVIYSSGKTENELTGGTESWNGTFVISDCTIGEKTIKQIDFSALNGTNSCGCFKTKLDFKNGDKLYMSVYASQNFTVNPVIEGKPGVEQTVSNAGTYEWKNVEIIFDADATVTQLGFLSSVVQTIWVDHIYIVAGTVE